MRPGPPGGVCECGQDTIKDFPTQRCIERKEDQTFVSTMNPCHICKGFKWKCVRQFSYGCVR
jgi:hypothetical protein